MNIVLTGSIGRIGKPLTSLLIENGHNVTVISSKTERQKEIEALGAKAATGSLLDVDFLTATFKGADIVYLLEAHDGAYFFDKELKFMEEVRHLGTIYKNAVEASGVKKVVHLSSIGADKPDGNGVLKYHYILENIFKQLPADVSIKTMRPVGFFTNLFSFIRGIKTQGNIVSNYDGDAKEPWVSPRDIAAVVAEEMDKPFEGRSYRYIASEEVSPDDIARELGKAIGKPDLKWEAISDEELLNRWLGIGMNEEIAKGFVELQASQRSGAIYHDYNLHKPALGPTKLVDFAQEFAKAYNQE